MCDEFTQADAAGHLGITRRDFAAMGGAAMLMAAGPVEAGSGSTLAEATVTITTPDGQADAFFVHPAKGRHPGIILWPDIAGLRDAYHITARKLAAAGFAVLAINAYYRSARAPVFKSFSDWRTPEGMEKAKPMIAAVTPEGTTRDAKAFVAFLDAQPAVDIKRKLGTSGYCMGGAFAVRTAAAVPGRVGAVASFHGAYLVNDLPNSPHRLIAQTKASYLFAIGRGDDARAPDDKNTLRAAAAAAHRPAEVEVYAAEHGWCTIDSPVYDAGEDQRAWGRMLALFGQL